jgi:hypothetical protein
MRKGTGSRRRAKSSASRNRPQKASAEETRTAEADFEDTWNFWAKKANTRFNRKYRQCDDFSNSMLDQVGNTFLGKPANTRYDETEERLDKSNKETNGNPEQEENTSKIERYVLTVMGDTCFRKHVTRSRGSSVTETQQLTRLQSEQLEYLVQKFAGSLTLL